jgi:DUF1680 family protein
MFALPRESFWCCTGTGVENFSKLQDSIYFHDDRTLYVNLFVASSLTWREQGVTVRQETKFPEEEYSRLEFRCEHPSNLDVCVRIPYWAEGAAVKVNGKLVAGVESGSHLSIQRTWKSGDRIDVALPMKLHVQPMPDDPAVQAFLYGPLVLAGRLGSEGLTAEAQSSDRSQQTRSHYLRGDPKPAPELRSPSLDPAAWIKPVAGQRLTLRTAGQVQDITMIPLNRLFGERYAVYWKVS